jgi:hypothetical protein
MMEAPMKKECNHEDVMDGKGLPYFWDTEVIATDVICIKCGRRAVKLWTYSHTKDR